MSRRAACGVLLVGLGWASLQAQVGLLRELLVAASGSELALLLGLAAWMLGTATGALLLRPGPEAGAAPIRIGLTAFALLAPAAVLLLRLLRPLAQEPPGALLPLGTLVLGSLPALALPGLLSGWLFVRLVAQAAPAGLPLGRAYGLESLGGLAGGLAATALPAAGWGNLAVILAAGGLAGLAALAAEGRGRWKTGWLVPLLLLGALPFSRRLDLRLARAAQPFLVEVRDTPYGRVAVTERLGQRAVFVDGALAFESQGAATEEDAHTAALLLDRPDRILLLGGVAEGFVPDLLQHRPDRIDCVELDRVGLALALFAASPGTRAALADPAVRLVQADPRRFLAESTRSYDLILSAQPEPRTGASSRMWTREAFAACRARLRPGGILAVRLHAPENLWPPLERQQGASILRALRAQFPQVRILPGADLLLVASDAPLSRDPTLPLARWRARGLRTRLLSEPALAWRLRDPRGPDLEQDLALVDVPPHTDARPIGHPLALALWLSRYTPRLAARTFGPAPGLAAAALLGAGLAAGVAFRRARASPPRQALTLAGFSGTAGLVLQGTLLLAFQARHGVLFLDLGLLLTLSMGGMAAGAAWLRAGPRSLLAGLALVALAAALAVAHPDRLAWTAAAALLAGSGAAGGALFSAAGRLRPAGAGPLYAGDLAGGCLGALALVLVLPFLGLPAGPAFVAFLALAGLALGPRG